MLAASVVPIQIGAVYYEDASGLDEVGDRFEITFSGGAASTELKRLVIDTDKLGDGLTIGDCLFDTKPGGSGVFGAGDLVIVDKTGIDAVKFSVADGGTLLVFDFTGFHAGEKLVFTIDVDEQAFSGSTAVAEGKEFEGTKLTATFSAAHFHDATDMARFFDDYDLGGTGLNLPPDDYVPPGEEPHPVRTAAALFPLTQVPLPITLAGTVYEDIDLDNRRDAGETGLAGVTLALHEWNGSQYVATGKTAVTDAAGNYQFKDMLPGKYRVVESQPASYFSIGAVAGKVGSQTRGQVQGQDIISEIELVGGEDSVGNDFAEARPATLSGHVYHDADNDGRLDAGETGIAGAKIRIYYLPSSGPAPAAIEVVTSADGAWTAGGLMPGNYRIEEVQPAGYLDGLDAVGSAGGTAQNPGDAMTGIRLTSGQAGANYDFGELLPSTIRGRVIADANGNGRYDAGEKLLSGVTVRLKDAQGKVLQTTTTDSSGAYAFTGLAPGVYGVEETQPAGYFDGAERVGSVGGSTLAPDSIIDIRLVSGTNATDYDFLEILPSSVRGRVIVDANGNGAIDAGEKAIAGVTVHLLDAAGKRIASTTTNNNGEYAFLNLAPGQYGVEEIQPAGYFDGKDCVGTAGGALASPDSVTGIRLVSGTHGERYDFLEILPSSIRGRVAADANANGVYDSGEKLLAGVTVHLLDSAGKRIATTTTNAQGEYEFTGLAPGRYGVEEIQPAGYFDGAEHLGSEGGQLVSPDTMTGIVLVSGTHGVDYDFYELLPSTIRGRVIADNNIDGQIDAGDTLLGGVTVHLLDASGKRIASTTTNAHGAYEFTGLAPGTYGVEEEQPAGYLDSIERLGSAGGQLVPPDSMTGVVLVSGTVAADYDFFEVRPASLSGYVYVDSNDNGVRDPGEVGIGGVRVTLLDAKGNATSTTATTDANGFYRFEGLLPGVYGVAETQPAGYFDGRDSAGTAGGAAQNPGDTITRAVLGAGAAGQEYNFGELAPASISGRVYLDDTGKTPLPGVTLQLLDENCNPVASTTTDAQGNYTFSNLKPGKYGIREIQPDGYFDGNDYLGSAGGRFVENDRVCGIVVGSGARAVNYDFTELAPGSISGYVFQDGAALEIKKGDPPPDPTKVRDGKFTSDDTPIAGVVITLGDASGVALLGIDGKPITAVTDARGYYEFNGLKPDTYTVLQAHPQGYVDSIDTAGTLGGLAVNRHTVIDPSLFEQLAVDPKNDAILLVRLRSGDKGTSYNFSEVKVVEAEPDIPYFPPPRPEVREDITPPSPPYAEPAKMRPVYLAAATQTKLMSGYGGGGILPGKYTWHLSVVNGGQPRRASDGIQLAMAGQPGYFSQASWSSAQMNRSQWIVADEQGNVVRQFLFGLEEGIPVTGDFDGDGQAEVGVFYNGLWFIDLNGNGIWDEGDLWARLGKEGDRPVTGDWDGDGKTDIGIFGPVWPGDARAVASEPGLPDAQNVSTGTPKNLPPAPERASAGSRVMRRTAAGPVRSDLIDHVFEYGDSDDMPIAGDWNGDGVANIGLFRDGTWYLDVDGNGRWSEDADIYIERFGQAGDIPVVGDFNGDGIDEIGVFSSGHWHLDSNGNRAVDVGDKSFELGGAGDVPVVADFNGDGVDEVALYRPGVTDVPHEQAAIPAAPEAPVRR